MKRIRPDLLRKYFALSTFTGKYVIDQEIRKAVRFQQHDLTTLRPVREGLSLIVCKNVLLHLSHEQRIGVLNMFRDTLADGGYLAVEQTQKMPQEVALGFEQVAPDAQIFRKVEPRYSVGSSVSPDAARATVPDSGLVLGDAGSR